MSKFYLLQNSFRSGEFGPKLLGRTDTKEYQDACLKLENLMPVVQGGCVRRMGSKYVFSTLSRPSMIPFVFSKTEGFAILLNHDGTNPTVIDKNGDLQKVILSDRVLANRDMSNWESWILGLDPNGWHHTQIGDVIIVVHNSSEVPPITIQRVDDPEEGQIFRFDWYLYPQEFESQDREQVLRWPFQAINIKEQWLQIGTREDEDGNADANGIYHTVYAREAQNNTSPLLKNFWDKDEVGSLIRIVPYNNINAPGAVEILMRVESIVDDTADIPTTAYPDKSSKARLSMILPIIYPVSVPNPGINQYMTKDWKKTYWSDFNGWPKTITGFESRLFFGGNKNHPDTVWGSLTSNIFHMMRERFEQDKNVTEKQFDITRLNYFGVETPADPLEIIPAAAEVNKIQWLHGGSALAVGTIGAEYILTGGAQGLSSDNLNFRRQTAVGSSAVLPASLKNSTYYISRTGRKLYDLITDPTDLVSETRDLNTLNEEIVKHNSNQLEELVKLVPQVATNTIWCLTSANQFIGFTMNEASGVTAWHRHTLGGENPRVLSIAPIPNEEGSFDDLWLAVERFGVGIKLLRTDEGNPGTDHIDFGTPLTFQDFPIQFVQPNDTSLKYPVLKRRLVTKIPDTATASDFIGTHFSISDQESWDIQFVDPALGVTSSPGNLNVFVTQIEVPLTTTRDQIPQIIADKLSNEYINLDVISPETGATSVPFAGSDPHFNFSTIQGTQDRQMRSSIIMTPAGSTFESLVGDIISNDEHFFIHRPGSPEKVYGVHFVTDPGDPSGGSLTYIPVSVPLAAGDTHTSIMNKIASALESEGFDIEKLFSFDVRPGYEHIERIGETFSNDLLLNDSANETDKPYYSDSSKRVVLPAPSNIIPGFDHLKGDVVQILADGFYIGDFLVNENGEITLTIEATEVIAGYQYDSILQTFPIEAGADWGSTVGVIQRIDRATTLFFKTFGARVGYSLDAMEDLEFLPSDYLIGDPLPLFTGRRELYFPASPDDTQFVIIEQSKPFPLFVTAIAMRGRSYDSSQ